VGPGDRVGHDSTYTTSTGLVAGAKKGDFPPPRGWATAFSPTYARPTRSMHVVRVPGDENVVHHRECGPAADIETIFPEEKKPPELRAYATSSRPKGGSTAVAKQAKAEIRVAIVEERWLREVIGELQSG